MDKEPSKSISEKISFKEMETKWKNKWEQEKAFEPSPNNQEKFFINVPYPYISGSLHIGHARVAIEADVMARYQRLAGKNVLYPMAFHISGTPVLGISLAIKNNDQSKIDLYKSYVRRYVSDDNEAEKIVKTFENPEKIVEFFIPKMIEEFKTLGLSVDWRRSYTSGDQCHQALVEWQFKEYKKQNYLVQGKYPILFSKTLNNAVGEDDIQDGDINPVEIQQFTGIKFEFEDGYLIAATLRPETMFGQTNMWVNPETEYVKIKVSSKEMDEEMWFVSKPCAEKLKLQDWKIEEVEKVSGISMMGKKCFAPFVDREIIILPSLHCDENIGTGIVTSVPSDAPFDWIALKELQESEEMCKKYNISFDEVKSIELIPIIKSKGYGEFPAVEICEKMNITLLSQHEKLAEATQEIYKAGFHTGVLTDTCGDYSGMKVIAAKDMMRQSLLDGNKAIIFYESSRQAKSRDGGEVVVAILDNQWFLDFNATGWKEKSNKCLSQIELWPDKYRKQFEDVFDWLDKRPCARMRGLGTKLPFDNSWVIESLSDSTIYMSLYPIAHKINEKNLSKDKMPSEFFDYIMRSNGEVSEVAKKTGLSEEELIEMNSEWNYWYPYDQRHTFTAHLSNHLSFMIFAHTAVFEEKYWPKRISFHGMVISEGEKMSKSKGNVVTLVDIGGKYGADPFRAFICNSTSVDSTFNWDSDKVEIMKKNIYSLFETMKEIQTNKSSTDNYKKFKAFISKTEKSIKKATEAISSMNLREYSNIILYDMVANYKKVKSKTTTDEELKSINGYIANKWTAMLCPLVPHVAEELWEIGGNKGLVSKAQWPSADELMIDEGLERVDDLIDNLRKDILKVKELAKIDKVSKVRIFVAPEWKWTALKMVQDACEERPDFGLAMKTLMADSEMKKYGKEIQSFLKTLINNYGELSSIEKFDEMGVINEAKNMLEKEFGVVEIISAEESTEQKAKNAFPGKPALLIE